MGISRQIPANLAMGGEAGILVGRGPEIGHQLMGDAPGHEGTIVRKRKAAGRRRTFQ
ncbi:hypothetical protein [Arthrobacter globiformis]|uniref:hypothetical protein n=1 Tax=Arthrobacter globiformis TaxID=1665 RepID=UPI00277EFB8E|nr:hypothetical protein [Arthrobacter globiformis]MDQ0864208.1 hypothetical protein [Arthrobacter globiformis]